MRWVTTLFLAPAALTMVRCTDLQQVQPLWGKLWVDTTNLGKSQQELWQERMAQQAATQRNVEAAMKAATGNTCSSWTTASSGTGAVGG